jgi:energy-coupling factor transporter ATP-binding protein EcfA2
MRLFISIFGPDGSGKSTQARILASHLVSQGFDVRIIWIKSYHMLAYILSRVVEWLSPSSVSRNAYGHIIRINPLCRNSVSKLLWSLIEFFSLVPLVLLRVYVPLLIGKTIITERLRHNADRTEFIC